MIKRFFKPLPLVAFLILAVASGYGINYYLPNASVIATTQITLISSHDEKLMPSTKITEEEIKKISSQAEMILAKEKIPSSKVFEFLENEPTTTDLFPADIDLKLTNENQELSLAVSYVPNFYQKETINLITEDIKSKLVARYQKIFSAQKQIIEQQLGQKNKIVLETIIEEKHEVVNPEKIVTKTTTSTKNVPPEIAENIVKFKEFKLQKELRLKEIEEQLAALSMPNQSPLIMLTSNLQKNYEMQIVLINGKKDWLKNADQEQIKKLNEEKNAINEKLMQENIRLRDESYYFKGQQDKALRLKETHLLLEEKNNKEMLEALNDLQNGLFEQDQNKEIITVKTNETNISPKNMAAENAEKEKLIKLTHQEIEELNIKLKEVEASLLALKNTGLLVSESHIQKIGIKYYQNHSILLYLGTALFILFIFTGLIFGASNKVSSSKVVSEIFGAPLLGTIPDLPNEGLENAKHKKLTDAIDQITDNLTKSMQNRDIKILNILSPDSNDGRTQLTGMLCLSFNLKKNMKVIALDTCFNNPKLADFLELKTKNLPNDEGLIAYIKHLIQTKEISESDNNQWLAKLVKPCIKNGIFVISPGAGSLTDNYAFNSKVISTMYEGLGKYVDLIIADTPPINASLSFVSKVLAENTNGNILLIKKGAYKKSELESIKKKLMGVQILGFILK